MTQIFVRSKYDLLEKRSFETHADVHMGDAVEIRSDGKVQLTSTVAKAIGVVDNMPQYRATNGSGTVEAGDRAQVILFGVSFRGETGGTFDAGGYVGFTNGKVVASGGATDFVAVEASTASGQVVDYLKIR